MLTIWRLPPGGLSVSVVNVSPVEVCVPKPISGTGGMLIAVVVVLTRPGAIGVSP